jgi:FkbM family methyltransferase
MSEELIVIRQDKVDNLGPWIWLKHDLVTFPIIKNEWERLHKPAISKYCNNKRIILQAGGNCGMYPKLLSKYFNIVYTLEPDPLNYFCLVNNCSETNIIKIQGGLMNEHGMLAIKHVEPHNVGMHQVEFNDQGFVPAFKIDDFKFSVLDAINLDVEGMEFKALIGGTATIEKHKPIIFLENGDTSEIKDMLSGLGYEIMEQHQVDPGRTEVVWKYTG